MLGQSPPHRPGPVFWSGAFGPKCPELNVQLFPYGAFTIHGSVAVPEPDVAIVPEVREMAGRTPYVSYTLPPLPRAPPEYRLNSRAPPFEERKLGESNQKLESERKKLLA